MRVLIIGLGSIAKKHIHALRAIMPKAEILALRSNKKAESVLDAQNVYQLNNDVVLGVDFVIISNPTSEHKKTIERLIPFGRPLFIEKPLHYSLNISSTINLTLKHKVFTYVACNLRFLDCLRFIKDKIDHLHAKRLNEVNVYCGSYLPDWRPEVDFKDSYSAKKDLGGGVHIDLIHEIDYIYWLYGTPKKVSRAFRSQSSLAISSIDYANYLLDYDGFSVNVVLNYFRRDPKRCLELIFSEETWQVDLLSNQITSNGEVIFKSAQRIADTYEIQMNYFINCLKDQIPTFNTAEEAYNVLKICLEK